MSATIFPFRKRHGGYVSIWPCDVEDGCWGVSHLSDSGSSGAFGGTYFSYAEAEAAAAAWATSIGADFDHDAARTEAVLEKKSMAIDAEVADGMDDAP